MLKLIIEYDTEDGVQKFSVAGIVGSNNITIIENIFSDRKIFIK